jgi:hypothetical protein
MMQRFYQVCEHLAPHQYEAAKKDFEYFMRLVDLAMAYFRDEVEGDKGVKGQRWMKYSILLSIRSIEERIIQTSNINVQGGRSRQFNECGAKGAI